MKIWGGARLEGEVWLPPAKNSVLPILAASLLCDGPVRLRQTPRLTDVENSLALLRAAGMYTAWEGEDLLLTPGRPGKASCRMGRCGPCEARCSIWPPCCTAWARCA